MEEKETTRRITHVIKIGPLLKELLDDQLVSIRDATYGVCDSSYWEAGEVIAKKLENL